MPEWYEQDPGRLAVEKHLMMRHYPQSVLVKLGGLIRSCINIEGEFACYRLEVVLPKRFPCNQPKAFIRAPNLKSGCLHRFPDGSLCLYHGSEAGRQTSVKVITDWSVMYVAAYEKWVKTGRWPEPEQVLKNM